MPYMPRPAPSRTRMGWQATPQEAHKPLLTTAVVGGQRAPALCRQPESLPPDGQGPASGTGIRWECGVTAVTRLLNFAAGGDLRYHLAQPCHFTGEEAGWSSRQVGDMAEGPRPRAEPGQTRLLPSLAIHRGA